MERSGTTIVAKQVFRGLLAYFDAGGDGTTIRIIISHSYVRFLYGLRIYRLFLIAFATCSWVILPLLSFRCSDNPIAIACFLEVTTFPVLEPLWSFFSANSFITPDMFLEIGRAHV